MADEAPGPAKRLAVQLGAIVRAGSARPVGSGATSGVGCTRRPGRGPCDGFVMVFRHANGAIAWACDVCGDKGLITGWEGSPSDLTELDDSYVDGDPIEVVMARELSTGSVKRCSYILLPSCWWRGRRAVRRAWCWRAHQGRSRSWSATWRRRRSRSPTGVGRGCSTTHALCSKRRWMRGSGVHGAGDEEVLGPGRPAGT